MNSIKAFVLCPVVLRAAGVAAILLTVIVFPAPSPCQTTANVDLDDSGKVDFNDFVLFAKAFGKQTGQEGYDASCDLDGSGKVDFPDFVVFARLFSETASIQPATYSLSGLVTEYVHGLGDVLVTLRRENETWKRTEDDGTYTFEGLQRGEYTLIPEHKAYAFFPDSLTVTLSNSNLSGLDFVARQSPYTARLSSSVEMELIWVNPGSFPMGSPSDERNRQSDEGPQHRVTLTRGFYLGKYEVTQAQWQAMMGTAPWSGDDNVMEGPNYPASNVTWYGAQSFVAEMNDNASDSLYRLPTEAEWEYACRAGTTTSWSFGEDGSKLRDYAWYWIVPGNVQAPPVMEDYPHAVGDKRPNPWGFHDMHGNVWEWCLEHQGAYPNAAEVDPMGPGTGKAHVVRGGAYHLLPHWTRSARRYGLSPWIDTDTYARHSGVGFRLLMRDR